MPFSYMSFLIQEKLENREPSALKNEFDIEAYNYIFNKSSCFMDGSFTRQDSDVLEYSLRNIHK
jgi:hypothetical protein